MSCEIDVAVIEPFEVARRRLTACLDPVLDDLSDIEFIESFLLATPVSVEFFSTDTGFEADGSVGVCSLGFSGMFVRTQWDEVVVSDGVFECAVPVPFAANNVRCLVALP